MQRKSKHELLDAAKAALVISERFNEISMEFTEKSNAALVELISERDKSLPDPERLFDLDRKIVWALSQAESYHKASKSYLKDARRLTRKARWMRG